MHLKEKQSKRLEKYDSEKAFRFQEIEDQKIDLSQATTQKPKESYRESETTRSERRKHKRQEEAKQLDKQRCEMDKLKEMKQEEIEAKMRMLEKMAGMPKGSISQE